MWDMQESDASKNRREETYKKIARELEFKNVKEMVSTNKSWKLVKAIELLCKSYEVPNVLEREEYKPTKEEVSIAELSQAAKLAKREWNYYFKAGTEVTLDKTMFPEKEDSLDFTYNLKRFSGVKGIVVQVSYDLHAFGQGTSYNMDIDFNGEIARNVWAPYVIEYEK
tara:strand:+ start:7837 stop:8340 length:504 start_codon:yes stop_codon:yes gene_type:complete